MASSPGTFWTARADTPPEPSIDAAKRHHAVVEAAWRGTPSCVPFRFGQWVPSRERLAAAAAERTEAFSGALAHVAGCAEFSVRILDPTRTATRPAPEPRPASGRAYLEQVRRRVRGEERDAAREAIARALADAVGPLAKDARVESLPSPHGVATVTHLVRRSDEEAWMDAVERTRARSTGLRFLVTGPWPPYTFAP